MCTKGESKTKIRRFYKKKINYKKKPEANTARIQQLLHKKPNKESR